MSEKRAETTTLKKESNGLDYKEGGCGLVPYTNRSFDTIRNKRNIVSAAVSEISTPTMLLKVSDALTSLGGRGSIRDIVSVILANNNELIDIIYKYEPYGTVNQVVKFAAIEGIRIGKLRREQDGCISLVVIDLTLSPSATFHNKEELEKTKVRF